MVGSYELLLPLVSNSSLTDASGIASAYASVVWDRRMRRGDLGIATFNGDAGHGLSSCQVEVRWYSPGLPTPPPTETPTPTPTPTLPPTATPTSSSVTLTSQGDCGNNQPCYQVVVDCNDLPTREAALREDHKAESNGALVFLRRGGVGRLWYGDRAGEIVDAIRGLDYETYELKWLGEQGYATDSFGREFKKIMCGAVAVVQWIATDVVDRPDVMGATGVSAGSNELASGLTLYGLEDILDVVVLPGGPPDLVDSCFRVPSLWRVWDFVMDWTDNGDYCQNGERIDWVVEALQTKSLISPLPDEMRDYNYPDTRVVFVEALIHRRTACRRPAEETKGCASESGIMVLKQ